MPKRHCHARAALESAARRSHHSLDVFLAGVGAEALRAGARGYLRKEEAGEELVKAVRAVAAGGSFLGAGIAELLIEGCRDEQQTTIFTLTGRERELLRLIIDGKTNSETAAVLGLSPRSVETHRLRLMHKLRIKDLPSLVRYAIRSGLTSLD